MSWADLFLGSLWTVRDFGWIKWHKWSWKSWTGQEKNVLLIKLGDIINMYYLLNWVIKTGKRSLTASWVSCGLAECDVLWGSVAQRKVSFADFWVTSNGLSWYIYKLTNYRDSMCLLCSSSSISNFILAWISHHSRNWKCLRIPLLQNIQTKSFCFFWGGEEKDLLIP